MVQSGLAHTSGFINSKELREIKVETDPQYTSLMLQEYFVNIKTQVICTLKNGDIVLINIVLQISSEEVPATLKQKCLTLEIYCF